MSNSDIEKLKDIATEIKLKHGLDRLAQEIFDIVSEYERKD
jgi:hypothetical protein